MDTIVIGFDGSEQSHDALALGALLASSMKAELVVAVVDEVRPFAWEYGRPSEGGLLEATLAEVAERLGSQSHTAKTEWGSAPECLELIANEVKADLIVVGSTHLGEVGKAMAGSVADRLFAGSPCSVAIAPRGYAELERPKLERIGVGFDGEDESKEALRVASSIAAELAGSLRLIAAVPHHEELIPGRISRTAPGYAAFVREYLGNELAQAAVASSPSVEVAEVLVEGEPDQVLRGQSAELDLLVLGSRGYGPIRRVFLGGVASKVVRDSSCPVVVVPRSALADRRSRREAIASTVF